MVRRTIDWALSGAVLLLGAGPAAALQPLEDFLGAAAEANFDQRSQRLEAQKKSEERWVAWTRILPVFSARASYTRNQYEAIAPGNRVIFPKDQRDLYLELDVPLIDVGQWFEIAAAKKAERAALAASEATTLEVDKAVVRAFYQVIASDALLSAARRTVESARENEAYVEQRVRAGVTSEVDHKRAQAEVERNRQSEADAHYLVETSRRSLATLSGLEPSTGALALTADRTPLEPLAGWLERANVALPQVAQQIRLREAAEARERATLALSLPSVRANAVERFTNAVGFGQAPYYALSAIAEWRFDLGAIGGIQVRERETAQARVAEERALAAAHDTIFADWHQVAASLTKSRAAESELEAIRLARSLTKQRYDAGTANWLDVILAERDVFQAEVSQLRADADLAYARAALSLSSGVRLTEGTR